MQTRNEFLEEFTDYIGQKGDSNAFDVCERILNRALRTIWGKQAWRAFLNPEPYVLSTVAGTRSYALPANFGRVTGADGKIRNTTTGREIFPATREEMEAWFPAAGTALDTGYTSPATYVLAGTMPVQSQPSSAGEALEVLSTSALDVAVRVAIGGLDANGDEDATQVTLTGTTPVAIGTWSKVQEFAKAYPHGMDPTTEHTSSEGTVRLRKVSGGTVLQSLLRHESARAHQVLTLHPTPDAAYTIAIPYMRAVPKRLRDADMLPDGWENALFEECLVQWKVHAEELEADALVPRPHLYDLVCNENAAAAQQQRHRTPHTRY